MQYRFPSNYRLAVDALNKGQPIVVENHNKLAAAFVGFARIACGNQEDRGDGSAEADRPVWPFDRPALSYAKESN